MILLGAIAIVFFGEVPMPWAALIIAVGGVLEIAETMFWFRLSGRGKPVVGVDAMVGKTATVIQPCRPTGQVRINGEIWGARCPEGADVGDTVQVRAVERLELHVERAGGNPRASHV
jgi:membrane protein implicated in regulation of membrane protease activity